MKGSTNFTAEAQRSQSRSFLLPFGGIFPPNKNFPPRALGVCGENLRQSEMRKLMFGLCLVMFLFGLSGCLFVYSQGPDCAVFGVYEPRGRVGWIPCLPAAGAGRKADPIIISTFPGSPALWARSFTTMCRSMSIPRIRRRFISPMPTATGDGITGNGAGSQGFNVGGSLLDSCRRD